MSDDMKSALQWYVAGVVLTGLDFVCHLTNHVGACWLSFRGPLKPLHDWAFDVLNPITEDQWRMQAGHDRRPIFPQRAVWTVEHEGPGFTTGRVDFSPPSPGPTT